MTKERAQEQKSGLTWPEWRLYANFLHRELARLWYGKKSIFTPVKDNKKQKKQWVTFSFIWGATVAKFGKTHGLAIDEMNMRSAIWYNEFERLSGQGVVFGTFIDLAYSFTRRVLGDKLASEFLFDFQITEIAALAGCAYGYATEGKMPPYEKNENLRPIEFYEGLPVAPELEEFFYSKNLA